MGSNVAPTYANIFMHAYETQHIYNHPLFHKYGGYYRRYIDDLFFLWYGPDEDLSAFVNNLNVVPSTIRFTLHRDPHSIHFLDVTLYKSQTKVFQKPTDKNTLLYYTRSHPRHLLNSLPRSQMLRVVRVTRKVPRYLHNNVVFANHEFSSGGDKSLWEGNEKGMKRNVQITEWLCYNLPAAQKKQKGWGPRENICFVDGIVSGKVDKKRSSITWVVLYERNIRIKMQGEESRKQTYNLKPIQFVEKDNIEKYNLKWEFRLNDEWYEKCAEQPPVHLTAKPKQFIDRKYRIGTSEPVSGVTASSIANKQCWTGPLGVFLLSRWASPTLLVCCKGISKMPTAS
ncbi:hypothetical protein XELAEV_18044395mg [Xenopus laevis]|uniref:Reverse transcriptase domain-containing protein n=1 Tax=Xenopus laevis TaxID=8355 RepID=A0A974BYW1_XENLA|nr:hypothetical protein XELAEV_18044395mg [Xenopus laevis]